jgi:hypothetical protein
MAEPKVASFEGWALVEMFGHAKEVGYVTTEAYGSAVLFRCDTPELPEREYVLEAPEYAMDSEKGTRWVPAGAKVKRPASPAKSRLIGPGAIYSITPCTEATARAALERVIRRELILLEMPDKEKLLQAPAQDRTFACCGGNPEDGHRAHCDVEDEEEIEQEDEERMPF